MPLHKICRNNFDYRKKTNFGCNVCMIIIHTLVNIRDEFLPEHIAPVFGVSIVYAQS